MDEVTEKAFANANNIRNRYRRMKRAWNAYRWAGCPSFREWATSWGWNEDCYAITKAGFEVGYK